MNNKGFTILELMIAVVIIAIITVLAASYYSQYLVKTHNSLIFSAYRSIITKANQLDFCNQNKFMTLGEYSETSIDEAIRNASSEIQKIGVNSQITILMQLNKQQICPKIENSVIITIPAGDRSPYPSYDIISSDNGNSFICNGNPNFGQPNGGC